MLSPVALIAYREATWSITNRWNLLGNGFVLVALLGWLCLLLSWLITVFTFRLEEPENESENENEENNVEVYKSSIYKSYKVEKEEEVRLLTYSKIEVSLEIKPIQETAIKIPYGAKLKMEEAFDSKIFKNFVIAYPKFNIKKHKLLVKEKIIPRIDFDPAICGITEDGRLHMIVYWDIKKDKDKTIKSIERFKKHKLIFQG